MAVMNSPAGQSTHASAGSHNTGTEAMPTTKDKNNSKRSGSQGSNNARRSSKPSRRRNSRRKQRTESRSSSQATQNQEGRNQGNRSSKKSRGHTSRTNTSRTNTAHGRNPVKAQSGNSNRRNPGNSTTENHPPRRPLPSIAEAPLVTLAIRATGIHPTTGDLLAISAALLDADGHPVTCWQRILNTGDDPGPLHLFGLEPGAFDHAPQFATVLRQLNRVIDGRVLITHDTALTWGFIAHEARRAVRSASNRNRRSRRRQGHVPRPVMIVDTQATARRQGIYISDSRLRGVASSYDLVDAALPSPTALVLSQAECEFTTYPGVGAAASERRAAIEPQDLLAGDAYLLGELATAQMARAGLTMRDLASFALDELEGAEGAVGAEGAEGTVGAVGTVGAEREGADRSGAEREGADRSGADQGGAGRAHANQIGADLDNAGRSGASQSSVDQTNANRSGAGPEGANRSGVDQEDASRSGANQIGAGWESAGRANANETHATPHSTRAVVGPDDEAWRSVEKKKPQDLRADRFGLQRSASRIAAANAPIEAENPGLWKYGEPLQPGMVVCVAPEIEMDPDVVIDAAVRAGLTYSEKLVREASLVVFNGTGLGSEHDRTPREGKAMHAHRKGIPLIRDTAFVALAEKLAAE